MHEVVFSDKLQIEKGVRTMGYREAPDRLRVPSLYDRVSADRTGRAHDRATESEDKAEMDLFVDAMKSIAQEVEEDPQTVLTRPIPRAFRDWMRRRGAKAYSSLETSKH